MKAHVEQFLNHDVDIVPGTSSGSYWMPQGLAGDRLAAATDPFGVLAAHVVAVPRTASFDAVSITVVTATGTLRASVGIYALDGANNYPGTLIKTLGEQGPGLTSGSVVTWPISPAWTPQPGVYAMAITSNEAGTWSTMTPTAGGLIPFRGKIVGSDILPVYRVDGTFTYGALPSTFPGTITEQTSVGGFQLWLRLQ